MLRIALCDDLSEDRAILRKALQCYGAAHTDCPPLEIVEFDNAFLLLDDMEKSGGFDLALLDICMPGILGTDVAREIRTTKQQTEIIFVTTSDEFAVEAFTLKATHYLVKPFSQKQFDEAFSRGLEKISTQHTVPLTFKLRSGAVCTINPEDIVYIECSSHSQFIYLTNNECLEARSSLSTLNALLDKEAQGQFASPYKGYVVNMRQIRTIEPNQIIMRSGQTVPLVKNRFREIRELYLNFVFETASDNG